MIPVLLIGSCREALLLRTQQHLRVAMESLCARTACSPTNGVRNPHAREPAAGGIDEELTPLTRWATQICQVGWAKTHSVLVEHVNNDGDLALVSSSVDEHHTADFNKTFVHPVVRKVWIDVRGGVKDGKEEEVSDCCSQEVNAETTETVFPLIRLGACLHRGQLPCT